MKHAGHKRVVPFLHIALMNIRSENMNMHTNNFMEKLASYEKPDVTIRAMRLIDLVMHYQIRMR